MLVRVCAGNARVEFTPSRIARMNDLLPIPYGFGLGFNIQAKISFSLRLVRSVTMETGVGKNRQDVPIKLDPIRFVRRRRSG